MKTVLAMEYEEVRLSCGDPLLGVRFADGWKRLLVIRNRGASKRYAVQCLVGAVNISPDTDLVVLPKIWGVDFVKMLLTVSRDRTPDVVGRLPDVVYHSGAKGRPVPLSSVPERCRPYMREYLVLLLAELAVLLEKEGTEDEGMKDTLLAVADYVSRNPYYRERLRSVTPSAGFLLGRLNSERYGLWIEDGNRDRGIPDAAGDAGLPGVRGALARAVRGIRAMDGVEPAVWPFLVDMPLLFELYCRHLLGNNRGIDGPGDIVYQRHFYWGNGRYWIPDILKRSEKAVVDCKYKTGFDKWPEVSDIRQLSGYARMNAIRKALGCSDGEEAVVIVLYPDRDGIEGKELNSTGRLLPWCHDSADFERFHFLGVHLPVVEIRPPER